MTLRIASRLVQLVGVCLFVIPTIASAQPAEPAGGSTEEAGARYKRGLEMYREENYRGALLEFKRAYELTHEYKVLYNVGQVCYQLQDYVCAVTSFEQYLRDGAADVPAERQQTVRNEIQKLRPRIANVTFVTNVPGVSLTIDDVPAGTTPLEPRLVSAGAHRVSATKEGYLPLSQTIEIAGADQPTIRLTLVQAGGSRVVVREKVAPTSQWTTLSYVGLGVGGALIAGAGVTGFMALNSSSKMKDEQYVGSPSGEATGLQSDVKAFRLTSDLLAGAGVITLAATLYFTLTRKVEAPAPAPEKKTSSLGVLVGPGGASVVGSF